MSAFIPMPDDQAPLVLTRRGHQKLAQLGLRAGELLCPTTGTNAQRRRTARQAAHVAGEAACPRHDPTGHSAAAAAAWMARHPVGAHGSPRKRPEDQGRRKWSRHGRSKARRAALAQQARWWAHLYATRDEDA